MKFNVYRVLDGAVAPIGFDFIGSITNENEVTSYGKSLLFELFDTKYFRSDKSFYEALLFCNVYGGSEQEVDKLITDVDSTLIEVEFQDLNIKIFHLEKYSTSRIAYDSDLDRFMGFTSMVVRWQKL